MQELLAPVRRGIWGLFDNGLISATNFLTMVLLARVLSIEAFGKFTLAYSVLLFFNSAQSALVIQPHTVQGAVRSGDEYRQYTSATAVLQTGFAAIAAALVAIGAMVCRVMDWSFDSLLFALVPAVIAWQCQEFVRRAMYTRLNAFGAFLNDLLSYGGQLVGVALLWQLDLLNPESAILVLALTSFLGTLLGAWQIRGHFATILPRQKLHETFQLNWQFGKWLLGGNLAARASEALYPIFAAGIIGLAAPGALKAVQTLLGPTNVWVNALEPTFAPRVARIYSTQGTAALRAFVLKLQIGIAICMGTYAVIVSALATQLLERIYGPEYATYGWLLAVVSMSYTLAALRIPFVMGLEAMNRTGSVFGAYLLAAIVNLTFGIGAIALFGIKGLGAGILLYMGTVAVSLWVQYSRATGRPLAPVIARAAQTRLHTAEQAGVDR